jgi:hypothetical protein
VPFTGRASRVKSLEFLGSHDRLWCGDCEIAIHDQ